MSCLISLKGFNLMGLRSCETCGLTIGRLRDRQTDKKWADRNRQTLMSYKDKNLENK